MPCFEYTSLKIYIKFGYTELFGYNYDDNSCPRLVLLQFVQT